MTKFLFILLSLLATSSFAATNDANKYKSNEPIEINSDALEVLQQEHKAIFTGHVVAVQGDVHLASEKMTVFYKAPAEEKGKPDDKPEAKKIETKSPAPEKNSIEKIIVERNVFLTTPEETASGAHGIYDVENHKIFLNDNVVLTKDKNVIKGERLVYDFATGQSTMNARETTAEPSGIATTTTQNGKKTRVKALFVPNSEEKLPSKQK